MRPEATSSSVIPMRTRPGLAGLGSHAYRGYSKFRYQKVSYTPMFGVWLLIIMRPHTAEVLAKLIADVIATSNLVRTLTHTQPFTAIPACCM